MTTKHNILVVEDEKGIRDLITNALKRDESINVYQAEDGFQALNIIAETKLDGIILDLKIPKLSGHDVLKRAFSELNFHAPIIILSGGIENSNGVKNQVSIENLLAYIVTIKKPCNINYLVDLAKKMIEGYNSNKHGG